MYFFTERFYNKNFIKAKLFILRGLPVGNHAGQVPRNGQRLFDSRFRVILSNALADSKSAVWVVIIQSYS